MYTGMMLIFVVSEIELRASLVLGKYSATELYLQSSISFFPMAEKET